MTFSQNSGKITPGFPTCRGRASKVMISSTPSFQAEILFDGGIGCKVDVAGSARGTPIKLFVQDGLLHHRN
jgi:hypothetical protein